MFHFFQLILFKSFLRSTLFPTVHSAFWTHTTLFYVYLRMYSSLYVIITSFHVYLRMYSSLYGITTSFYVYL